MSLFKLQELTLSETRRKPFNVAVLPVGSTESHGPHVPYGSDAFHSTEIASRSCERAAERRARVLLLPTLPYGVQGNTMGFPLAMNVRQSTLDRLLGDIADSLAYHGIRKLVIVNGHGGNDFKPFLRDSQPKSKVFISLIDWWKVGADRVASIFEKPGEHADELETSVGMYLFGNLVHLERARDGSTRQSRFEAIRKGWVSVARPWHLVTKDSTFGDPRKASREKGEKYVSIVVERIAHYLEELSRSRTDRLFPY